MNDDLVQQNFQVVMQFDKITRKFYKDPSRYVDSLRHILMKLTDARTNSISSIWDSIQYKINQIVMNNATYSYTTSYKVYRKEMMDYDQISVENLYRHFYLILKSFVNENIILGNDMHQNPNFVLYFGTLVYYFHRIMSLLTLNINYFAEHMITVINQFTGCEYFAGFVNRKTYDSFYNDKIGKMDKYEIGSRYIIINTKENHKYKLCFVNLVSCDRMEPDIEYVQNYLSS